MKKLFAACLLSIVVVPVPVFAMYRCDAGGKITYQDQACSNGKEIRPNVEPISDPQQARRLAFHEKEEAARLGRQRAKAEAQENRNIEREKKAVSVRQKKCMLLAQRRRWAEEDAARASGKAVEKARLKARRAAERSALECRDTVVGYR